LGSVCAGIALLGTFFIHIRPDASSSLSDASDEVRAL
jgi:hypothetical protein